MDFIERWEQAKRCCCCTAIRRGASLGVPGLAPERCKRCHVGIVDLPPCLGHSGLRAAAG